MTQEEFKDFKLEIEELTELLNKEWFDLKNAILEKNITLTNTLLVGYYESEEGLEIGLLYNKSENLLIRFEMKDDTMSFFNIKHINDVSNEFPQISVAIAL